MLRAAKCTDEYFPDDDTASRNVVSTASKRSWKREVGPVIENSRNYYRNVQFEVLRKFPGLQLITVKLLILSRSLLWWRKNHKGADGVDFEQRYQHRKINNLSAILKKNVGTWSFTQSWNGIGFQCFFTKHREAVIIKDTVQGGNHPKQVQNTTA